jgi:hypothetical protein
MSFRPDGPVGVRFTAACLTIAVSAAALGCGGGGAPSKSDYYGSIDSFCGAVASAAKQVSKDTLAVQKDTGADRTKVVKVVADSLQQFADSTENALQDLEKTGVPKAFSAYQDGTSSGFRKFITTLRSTAKAAQKDGAGALSQLGPKLNAVKLPDPPKDVTANAKACASFTPAGG